VTADEGVVIGFENGVHTPNDLTLELTKNSFEKVAFVGELVVQGAAGDTGPRHDLFGSGGGKTALGEELACGRYQHAAGGLALASLLRLVIPDCIYTLANA